MTIAPSVTPDGVEATKPRRRPAGRRQPLRARDTRSALLFISPWIIGFLVFTAWPIINSLYLSFTDYDVLTDANFVGVDNYVQLFNDPKVASSLTNTLIFALIKVPVIMVVALALALLLNQATQRTAGFFRTVFFIPNMTPTVAVGVLFLLLFNGNQGLINGVLGVFGIQGPAWTTDPGWVKVGLVLISLLTVGGSIIILLAAIRNVPVELYESARIDGANFWQQTIKITIPMISPNLFFVFIVDSIAALQTFTEAYTAFSNTDTSGGFSNSGALFYAIYLFQQAFSFLHMGYASAMAWILFLIVMVITAVQFIVSRRFIYYEGDQS